MAGELDEVNTIDSAPVCLFCRQPLRGIIHPEHVIPQAMGGSLVVFTVCNDCNNLFGTAVDTVSDNYVLAELRREAGVKLNRSYVVRNVDPSLDNHGPWYVDEDDNLIWSRDIVDTEDGKIFYGRDEDEALRKVEIYNEKMKIRGKKGVTVGQPDFTDFGVQRVEHESTEEDVERLNNLLLREAAKIAIEFIGVVDGAAMALSPLLDDIRAHALTGEPSIRSGPDLTGPPLIRLPRTGRALMVGPRRLDKFGDDEFYRQLGNPDDNTMREDGWEPPAAVPRLRSIYHQMSIGKIGITGWFFLVLFGWVRVRVRLPAELPLSWGSYRVKNFKR